MMAEMGLAPPTRRAVRVAVGALTDALGRPELPLDALLDADLDGVDWGPHGGRRGDHVSRIESLRRHRDLPWTEAWQSLWNAVVTAGVGAGVNPLPTILLHAAGREPGALDRPWAKEVDRRLRSTLDNPPHGRADLAHTFARNLAKFDALHDIPGMGASGLLPPPVGHPRG